MKLAAFFLLAYAVALTMAPAARMQSWEAEYQWGHWIGFVVWLIGTALVHHELVRWLPERDPFLFPIGSILVGWGLLSIWRLDVVMGTRQTIWLAVCLAVFAVGLRIPNLLELVRRYKYIWLISGLLLTAATFVFGVYPGGVGPRLWLGCCGVYLQPSEPLKLLLIAYLSAYLADRLPVRFHLLRILTPTLILIGIALALLVNQRDLGTASLFILIYTVIVFVSSQKIRTLFISLVVLAAAGGMGYFLFDVVRLRVDAWLNPWLDPAGRSYQIIQSIIAVASGGFIGRGPGLGSPGLVPVAHSDFIFASLAEETGLLGAVGLIMIFALLVGRGIHVAICASNNYRRYLAAGITAYLVMQAIFIIGGNLRMLPLTGVTLPFVSYGGSSLLTAFVALLLLILISSQDPEDVAPLKNPVPYLLTGTGLLVGLLGLALVTGWWSIVRGPTLLARPENPRRIIAERYVERGALLDRNDTPLNRTIGQPGNYQREYAYPTLTHVTGYTSPLYGQSGLEAGYDDVLRGLRGNPDTLVWVDDLLYGQPPPGLDVRLSIDVRLQSQADNLLTGHKGALVLLDASNGEVLAMASRPVYDANNLEANWLALRQDADAPLLNRATQGTYPPGGALGPFLLAYAQNQSGVLPALPSSSTLTLQGVRWSCALDPQNAGSAGDLIASGCPAALAELGQRIDPETMTNLFESLGFYTAPALPLEVAAAGQTGVNNTAMAAIGQENLTVTPLQMALAAAALSNNGLRPSPLLVTAIRTPDEGWQPVPSTAPEQTVLAGKSFSNILTELSVDNQPYWQVTALARSSTRDLSWYVAGSLPQWRGRPVALVLILEERNPRLAQQIGQSIIESLIQ